MKKTILCLLLLCALLVAGNAATADSYSKVYGKTTSTIRVRSGASTTATITDNIVENACVYILSSRTSSGTTFVSVRYRASDGSLQTGWCAQKSGSKTYIKVLTAKEAKNTFGVSGGNLPTKRVGTFSRKTTSTSSASSSSSSSSTSSSSSSSTSKLSVSTVKDIQTKLKAIGMYSGSITGNIGAKTTAAIKAFQKKYGLTVDGIAGQKTIAKLNSVYTSSAAAKSSSSTSTSSSSSGTVQTSGTVYTLNWFKAKNNGIFKKIGLYAGYRATLKDLTTGLSLTIRIQSAGNHLDVEPATASDTAVLCNIYGVSSASEITSKKHYQRRPMLLTTSTGYKFVCSMYGVPHGEEKVTDNKYPGQFCLHFLNSKTHSSDKVDSDHMAAIQKAANMISSKVVTLEDL